MNNEVATTQTAYQAAKVPLQSLKLVLIVVVRLTKLVSPIKINHRKCHRKHYSVAS